VFALLPLGLLALVVGVPIAMWAQTWPDALSRWFPRVIGAGQDHQGLIRADGPPREVRLAALGAWILGTMFVPGLLLGLFGLVAAGLGLVSVPGLYLAWRLFFLGRPLLLGEPAAAARARGLAQFARILNYLVLAACGVGVALQVANLRHPGTHPDTALGIAMVLAVAVYAGVSLAHAALLDRAAAAIDAQTADQAAPGGVRVDYALASAEAPAAEGMFDEGPEGASEKKRGDGW
jgi:hypothetical protein